MDNKIPTRTSTFKNVGISFTTSPICEYIGSHIYQILGLNVHETKLGTCYNSVFDRTMLVVACNDFTENDKYKLIDYEAIKNNYSEELLAKLYELNLSLPKYENSNYSAHTIPIEEIFLQFSKNNVLLEIPEIINHFWSMIIIDCLINNNDRNKNNWGLLEDKQTHELSIAPVYDNGSSFVSKHTDEKLQRLLRDDKMFINSVCNGLCYYTVDHKLLNFKNFFYKLKEKNLDEGLNKTAKWLVPLIENKLPEIINFINLIPENENGVQIISNVKKEFFIRSIETRLNLIIKPLVNIQ